MHDTPANLLHMTQAATDPSEISAFLSRSRVLPRTESALSRTHAEKPINPDTGAFAQAQFGVAQTPQPPPGLCEVKILGVRGGSYRAARSTLCVRPCLFYFLCVCVCGQEVCALNSAIKSFSVLLLNNRLLQPHRLIVSVCTVSSLR